MPALEECCMALFFTLQYFILLMYALLVATHLSGREFLYCVHLNLGRWNHTDE